MPFVPAKCTQCGSNIQVDDTKELGICESCGTPFITERVINNYVTQNTFTTNVTNTTNVNADVVHIHEDEINKLFVVENGTLTKYNGGLSEIVIPEGIVRIGSRALKGCGEIEKVTLAKTVEVIEKEALDHIPEVEIPFGSQLRKIGDGALYYEVDYQRSAALPVVFLPKTLVEIGEKAFKHKTLLCYEGSEEEFKQKFPDLYESCGYGKEDEEEEYDEENEEENAGTDVQFFTRLVFNVTGFGAEQTFYYAETAEGVWVYDCAKQGKVCKFPHTLAGKKVLGFSSVVMGKASNCAAIYFPEGLKRIDGNFWKDADLDWDWIQSKDLFMPASLEYLGVNVFGERSSGKDRTVHLGNAATEVANWEQYTFDIAKAKAAKATAKTKKVVLINTHKKMTLVAGYKVAGKEERLMLRPGEKREIPAIGFNEIAVKVSLTKNDLQIKTFRVGQKGLTVKAFGAFKDKYIFAYEVAPEGENTTLTVVDNYFGRSNKKPLSFKLDGIKREVPWMRSKVFVVDGNVPHIFKYKSRKFVIPEGVCAWISLSKVAFFR